MENIGAVMLKGKIAVGQDQASLPKNEDQGFSEMLAVFLGVPSLSGEVLPSTLAVEQALNGDSGVPKELEKGALTNLSAMFTSEFQGKVQQEGEELVPIGESPWLEYAQSNIDSRGYLGEPSVEVSPFYEKAEKFLQQHSLNSKELAFFQQMQNQSVTQELPETPESSIFNLPEIAQLANSGEPEMAKEVKLNENNFKTDLVKNVEETKEAKPINTIKEGDEANNLHERTINLKNEVSRPEENWSSAFLTKPSENVENTAKEIKLSAEHFSRDLPEIVISKLKTFANGDGSKDVIIHLEPKELGKLVVKLTSQEGMVSVKFMAHYPVTRDLLESGLHNLRQAFLEQGISFDRLDVELGGQQLDQSQYQQQQQLAWAQNRGATERSGGVARDNYAEPALAKAEPDSLMQTGTYDYLV